MKESTVKTKVREITLLRVIITVLGALLVTGLSLLRHPFDRMTISPVAWIPVFVIPLAVLAFYFMLLKKPEPSVFRSVKWLYIAGTPFIPFLVTGAVFDPNRPEQYSGEDFGFFLLSWSGIWVLSIAAAYFLLLLLEALVQRGREKGSAALRISSALAVMYTPQKILSRQKREGKGKWVAAWIIMPVIAVAVFVGTVTLYLNIVYTNMDFEAILFTLRFAAGGIATEDFIAGTAIFLVFASITVYFCAHLLRCFINDRVTVADNGSEYTLVLNSKKRAVTVAVAAILFFGCAALFSGQTDFAHYISVKLEKSTIYEEHYVKPDASVVSFPGEKRNLIYIYLESMENTYASKEAGGDQDKNYISELTDLTHESDCVSFSNNELLGGPSVFVPSITYTMGSTVAQTAGISLNTKLMPQAGVVEFPATIRLEDILHDNGYNQLYIEGSKGEFSMYDKYVGRYDDCLVYDRISFAEQGYTDESADYIWKWGIEDRKLFELTKELITDMSKKDRPFFVTMYTMDTHSFESGHRCPLCNSSISNDYLASVDCTSRQTKDFIDWVRQQPFYENTTVILIGDHLGNKRTTQVDIEDDYLRTTYNCIVNPAKTASSTQNRLFSSLDMFPTTLSAIGAEIKGDRLGLGTDLFSATPTLSEELGEEEYKRQLEQSSDYYDREFY